MTRINFSGLHDKGTLIVSLLSGNYKIIQLLDLINYVTVFVTDVAMPKRIPFSTSKCSLEVGEIIWH